MKTLCVVDLQQQYMLKSYHWYYQVIKNCQIVIERAIQKSYPIVLVEFDGAGQTIEPINSLLKNYNKLFRMTKFGRSGAFEINSTIIENYLPTELEIVGVNYHQCIVATVADLLKNNEDLFITVYKNASNSRMFRHEKRQWTYIHDNPKLRIRNVRSTKVSTTIRRLGSGTTGIVEQV